MSYMYFHIMSYWNKIHNSFGLELYSVLNERVTEREKTDGCRTDMTDTKTPYTRPYTRPGIIIKMFKTSQSQFTKFTGRTLHLSMLVIRHLSFLSIFLHVEAIQFLIFLFPPVAEYPMWPYFFFVWHWNCKLCCGCYCALDFHPGTSEFLQVWLSGRLLGSKGLVLRPARIRFEGAALQILLHFQ